MRRVPPAAGQESVWDYPRPPRLEPSSKQVMVSLGDRIVADTRSAFRVLETSHPPTWYLPRADVDHTVLIRSSARGTLCEWKGLATYWDIVDVSAGAWSYEAPTPDFAAITGYLSFMPALFDCRVAGERVRPQDGGFYGGWITDDVVGPFKGSAGSWGW